MSKCPKCGERLLRLDGTIWRCHNNHRYDIDDTTPDVTARVVGRPWLWPLLTITGSGALTVLLVEVLK